MSAAPRVLRAATRGSALALAQVEQVASALRAAASIELEPLTITTQGDRDRETPLTVLGGEGVFAAAVREAVLDGRADIAVHSLKDVPTAEVAGLVIAAVLERADPRDAFIGAGGRRLAELPAGARVGTSASRRVAMLRALRPDLEVVSIRGNVDTRLGKLAAGEYDGIVLAAAGLQRLGRLAEATQLFEAREFLPSPGQGAIAVECRAEDADTLALLTPIDHAPTRAAVTAERGVLAALGAGCNVAVGAYAEVDGDLVALRALLGGDVPGEQPVFGDAAGRVRDADGLGRGLGERLREAHAEAGGTRT
ncbi:MAG: hydroxymethylbilane synthase [Dehalococcoidia bacterium]